MTGFRAAALLICSLGLAWPALGQHAGRDHGGARHAMPPVQRPAIPHGQRPPERPVGTLTREERQALNRDLNQANRELDQQRGGPPRR